MHPPHTQIIILFHNEPPFLCCIYYNAIGDEHQNSSCLSVRQIGSCHADKLKVVLPNAERNNHFNDYSESNGNYNHTYCFFHGFS